jgi:hypothetical protein
MRAWVIADVLRRLLALVSQGAGSDFGFLIAYGSQSCAQPRLARRLDYEGAVYPPKSYGIAFSKIQLAGKSHGKRDRKVLSQANYPCFEHL